MIRQDFFFAVSQVLNFILRYLNAKGFVKFGQEIIFTLKMQKGIEWVLTLNYVSVRGQGHDGFLC